MKASDFRSESGLRPASAFLMIACVLIAVSVNAVRIAIKDVDPPSRAHVQRSPEPDFDIVDRNRVPLAFSVRRSDLIVSPRAAWRAHTPDFMAGLIVDELRGACTERELLDAFLPKTADGVFFVPAEKLLLDRAQAERVCELIDLGVFGDEDDPRPLEGVYVVAAGEQDRYLLGWEPEHVLSVAYRNEQSRDVFKSIAPIAWTNELLFALGRALRGGDVVAERENERARLRMKEADQLWDLLMPSGHEVALRDVPLDRAYDLICMLEEQGLKSHQMVLSSRIARAWPQRDGAVQEGALEILGRWGHVGPRRAEAIVEQDLGFVRPVASVSAVLARPSKEFESAYRESLDELHPVSGLERSIDRMLRRDEWSFLDRGCAEYRFKEFSCSRPKISRRYFLDACASSATPLVTTTLDLDLQTYLRRRLDQVMLEHDPALSMALVADVQTGEVLAVDGLSAYGVRAFLPTWHLFTPGSTFKVVVMATALDAQVTDPDRVYNAHFGEWRIPGTGRVIHEAEGERKEYVTASEALAYSLNVVFTQIGLSIEDDEFRGKLVELGYVDPPHVNLGTERRGYVPSLPWKPRNEHASVSFGHEVQTSLWSHATALATVLRGGEYKPLRLLSSVEQHDVVYDVPEAPKRPRVFTAETCNQVREMMTMGAQVGTGRELFDERVAMGTKTGTTEKVRTELCLHVELQHNSDQQDERQRDGHVCNKSCRKALHQVAKPHKRSCYTSSICAFGRMPGTERELMVLLVVDEPRSGEKYGSRVAGPAARDILFEALGVTRDGLELAQWTESPVAYPETGLNQDAHPWAEVLR